MTKLSKEKAEWHYKKLVAIHNFEYLSLAQKVSIFFHDLEHDILREITGKQEFFDQWNWLKKNQLVIKDHGNETGSIPPTLVTELHSFKPWRNKAQHNPSITIVTYLNLFQTMAETIKEFSDIQWPDEINNIINNNPTVDGIKQTGKMKTPVDNEILHKTINYKNNTICFKKDNNELFQDFVKKVVEFMFNHSLLSDNEIKLLKTKDYSKETFGIDFPLLQDDKNKITFEGHCRYWKKIRFGGIYYCCSQWWLGKMSEYEPLFAKWMEKIFNDNKIN